MFLKHLIVEDSNEKVIRKIDFKLGLNLIIDETSSGGKETGNNIGKTTTLALIDFCLGKDPKYIYSDLENKKSENLLVKRYLINNKIRIILVLKRDINDPTSEELVIKRNFLQRKSKLLQINGEDFDEKSFEKKLYQSIFLKNQKKPGFRQAISHNIRYENEKIERTIETLNRFAKKEEYEALYLFLLGCKFDDGSKKQDIATKLSVEKSFKKRIENGQTESAYKVRLDLINKEIIRLNTKKESINIDPNYKEKIDTFDTLKIKISAIANSLSNSKIRRDIIVNADKELQSKSTNIDHTELENLYKQASSLIPNISKSFRELCDFHNNMIESKRRFIKKGLPDIEKSITNQESKLKKYIIKRDDLNKEISSSSSYKDLEDIIHSLNENHNEKGRLENTLDRILGSKAKIEALKKELSTIDIKLFSEEFRKTLDNKISLFNDHFSKTSNELYGEKYVLKADPVEKKGRKYYDFESFNANFSSGKKQGEVLCFDIALILYSRQNNLPCLSFLLNDKKELLHDNQFIKVADYVKKSNIQLVLSMLKNKIPESVNIKDHTILTLSQNDKLFRI